jgi:hypothetical protein
MRERAQYALAITAAETMYELWELENHAQELALDNMMRGIKNGSAYSLTRAETMDQPEGVEPSARTIFLPRPVDPASTETGNGFPFFLSRLSLKSWKIGVCWANPGWNCSIF